jgi:chitin disaccharide deacetylase
MTRALVVCADDLGRTEGINRGIVAAHQHGIVTSASLMVRWPAAEQAAAIARDHPGLAIGLHLDLCEWVFRQGSWREVYRVVDIDDPCAVRDEVARQLERFERILGRPPTHLDSHQHVHREEPVASALQREGERLGVPVRGRTPGVVFCGDFHGQSARAEPYPEGIAVEALLQLIRTLPPGTAELCTHPGDPAGLDSPYREERAVELRVLCDARVREELDRENVQLLSFAELSAGPV